MFRISQNYLENSKLSLTEIAFLLGYAEQIAFRRAFKQWEIFLHLNIEKCILYQLKKLIIYTEYINT